MGSKNKLKRFEENKTFANVIQPSREELLNGAFAYKGRWKELIECCFAPEEVSEIWITFPDPQIKYKRTKHRLTNADFLTRYQHILAPEGYIHLKTDSEFMHGYTLGLLHGAGHKVLYANHNIYNSDGVPEEVTEIKTFYEQFYLEQNKPITYIRFQIKKDDD